MQPFGVQIRRARGEIVGRERLARRIDERTAARHHPDVRPLLEDGDAGLDRIRRQLIVCIQKDDVGPLRRPQPSVPRGADTGMRLVQQLCSHFGGDDCRVVSRSVVHHPCFGRGIGLRRHASYCVTKEMRLVVARHNDGNKRTESHPKAEIACRVAARMIPDGQAVPTRPRSETA